jgi:hypothetical protein
VGEKGSMTNFTAKYVVAVSYRDACNLADISGHATKSAAFEQLKAVQSSKNAKDYNYRIFEVRLTERDKS